MALNVATHLFDVVILVSVTKQCVSVRDTFEDRQNFLLKLYMNQVK